MKNMRVDRSRLVGELSLTGRDTLILLVTIKKKVTHVDTQTVNKMLSQLIDLTVYRND